jgi:hypothetical protein
VKQESFFRVFQFFFDNNRWNFILAKAAHELGDKFFCILVNFCIKKHCVTCVVWAPWPSALSRQDVNFFSRTSSRTFFDILKMVRGGGQENIYIRASHSVYNVGLLTYPLRYLRTCKFCLYFESSYLVFILPIFWCFILSL